MAASISGWPSNEEPTSAAARSRTSSSVTFLAAGLFSGAAWRSSLSIKKWLIASALAAWTGPFSRRPRPGPASTAALRGKPPVLRRSALLFL